MAELLAFIIVFIALWFFESTRLFAMVFTGLITIIFLAVLVHSAITSDRERLEREEAEREQRLHFGSAKNKIRELVYEHEKSLALRRATLIQVDRYGVIDDTAWDKEAQYFSDKVVLPALTSKETAAVAKHGVKNVVRKLIDDHLADARTELNTAKLPTDITPLEFEAWVAERFRQNGWDATTTSGSGDQGADVLAKKDGTKIAIQCKLYTGAVGNKAVQEVFTAKQHYGCDHALVITTGEFTPSARQVAGTTGVTLIHHSELLEYMERIQPKTIA